MITIDQDKVAAILARRNAPPQQPTQPQVATHTIERVYYEPAPQSPMPPSSGEWSFRDVMQSVEQQELSDVPLPPMPTPIAFEPLRSPDEILAAAVRSAIANAADNQRRYELAVQARNGKAEAMTLIELEAIERGVSIADMVQVIIDQRTESERKTMQIIAAEVRWRRAIADAGEAATDVANAAAAELATL